MFDQSETLPSQNNLAESQIKEIFHQHAKTLTIQMNMTRININTWRENSVKSINQYADEQLRLLEESFERQKNYLDETFEGNVQITCVHINDQALDSVHQLLDQCRLLEFQVAQLENITIPIESPKVLTVEEQNQRKKRNSSEMEKIKNELEQRNNPLSNEKKQKLEQSRTPEPCHSITTIDLSQDDDQQLSKHCFVCLMIYAATMTDELRQLHVNEHFQNDS